MRDLAPPLRSLVLAPSAGTPDAALIDMHRRFLDLKARISRGEADDEDMFASLDVFGEASELRPTTLSGALAALELARWEFGRHYVEECEEEAGPDTADVQTLALIDGVLGVLRQLVEGGARV